jgi:hypothetical protein
MKCLIVSALAVLFAATAAAPQTPLSNPGKDSQNPTGRTTIPEKIGPPLRQREPTPPDSAAKQNEVVPDLRDTNPKAPQGSGAGSANDHDERKK